MIVTIYYLMLIKPEETALVILFPVVLLLRTVWYLHLPSSSETERRQSKGKKLEFCCDTWWEFKFTSTEIETLLACRKRLCDLWDKPFNNLFYLFFLSTEEALGSMWMHNKNIYILIYIRKKIVLCVCMQMSSCLFIFHMHKHNIITSKCIIYVFTNLCL